jgi:NAD(P)-dependent dehydrogenase (short-subunit alcohol dehydrogenase family)
VALAALPVIPVYSISKAAAFNMTQSLRAVLPGHGVTVHAVVLGPIDTDMNRGFEMAPACARNPADLALQHKVVLVYYSHGFRAAGDWLCFSDPY